MPIHNTITKEAETFAFFRDAVFGSFGEFACYSYIEGATTWFVFAEPVPNVLITYEIQKGSGEETTFLAEKSAVDVYVPRRRIEHTDESHTIGGPVHDADTLANLNSKISDATLDDISGTRDPNTHAIDGAAHSGSLAHSSLSGIGANDHHTHLNKVELDLVSDGDHDVRTDNPHGVDAGQVGAPTAPVTVDNEVLRADGTAGEYQGSVWLIDDSGKLYRAHRVQFRTNGLGDGQIVLRDDADLEELNITRKDGEAIISVTGTDAKRVLTNIAKVCNFELVGTTANEKVRIENSSAEMVAEFRGTKNTKLGGTLDTEGKARIGNDFTSPYQLSVQRNDAYVYIEILNSGGVNKGAFFGMETWGGGREDFAFYNWQGGDIVFWVDTVPSSGNEAFTIKNTGVVRIHGLGSGVVQSDSDGNLSSSQLSHTALSDIGSNAHTAIDSHIADAGKHREINDVGTGATELWSANKINTEINALSSGMSRRNAVIDYVDCTVAPPTEISGDRYILDYTAGTVHASWDGAAKGDIVEFNGTLWIATTPLEGWIAFVDLQNKDIQHVDDGTPNWEFRPVAVTDHADLTNVTANQHHNQVHGLGSSDHTTATLAELNAKVSDATLDDSGDSRTPLAHTATHQSGGSDPIKLDHLATPDDNTDLNSTTLRHGLLAKLSGTATDVLNGNGSFGAVPVHVSRHQNGGADELNVAGLNGVLADKQDADKLQGRNVASTLPTDAQVLAWNNSLSQWEPQDQSGGDFGDDYQTAVSLGRSTTTSDTYQTKVTLTTPALTGTYRVSWHAVWDNGGDLGVWRLRNTTDSSTLGVEIVSKAIDTAAREPIGGWGEVVFSGSAKTFEIQYKNYNGSATQGIQNARIEIWRVS